MSTFQVVLVPTVVGVAANELFPKVGQPSQSHPLSNSLLSCHFAAIICYAS